MIAGILLNAMFLLGTFTFAVVLGVVSDDISSEVKVTPPVLLPSVHHWRTNSRALLDTVAADSASMQHCMWSVVVMLHHRLQGKIETD